MEFAAALIDLDHTLLGPEGQISEENRHAVMSLKQRGLKIVLASGRSYQQMLWVHEQLHLDEPMICSNGGVIYLSTTRGGKIIRETCLSSNETHCLWDFARERNLTFYTYHSQGVFVWYQNHWNKFDHGHYGEVPLSFAKPEDSNPAQKVFISLPESDADALYSDVEQIAQIHDLFIWRGGPETIEVQPRLSSKFEAWKYLAAFLGVQPTSFVAFGDGQNDVAILRNAAIGVAMSNATSDCIEAADFVSPPGPAATSFARGVEIMLSINFLK